MKGIKIYLWRMAVVEVGRSGDLKVVVAFGLEEFELQTMREGLEDLEKQAECVVNILLLFIS